jgi:hypothetical protein
MTHHQQRRFGRHTFLRAACASVLCATLPAHAGSAPVEVTAKLVEIPGKLPPDDLYDYAFVMRYEVPDAPPDKQILLVAHYKPLQARSKVKEKMKGQVGGKLRSFTVGDMHKLKLSPDLKQIWKGPLLDEYSATDRKSVRYWCLQVDPA